MAVFRCRKTLIGNMSNVVVAVPVYVTGNVAIEAHRPFFRGSRNIRSASGSEGLPLR